MKRLKKWFALFLALVLSLSSLVLTAAADEGTRSTPFTGGKSLTVNTTEAGQSYTIYQIFSGSMSDIITTTTTDTNGNAVETDSGTRRLADVKWGLSIQKTDGDNTYDLTTALITALKAEKLPDGVTLNPLAERNQVKNLKEKVSEDGTLQSSASDVARALEDANANELNAFAQIVGYVIQNSKVSVDADSNATVTEIPASGNNPTTYSFVFSGIKAGYYMVEDTAAVQTGATSSTSNSRYLLNVSTTDTIAEVKTEENPSLTKQIVKTTVTASEDGIPKTEESFTDYIDAAIADLITFQLESCVPYGMEYYNQYYFVIDDTLPEGLTYKENSMTVSLISPDGTTIPLSSSSSGNDTKYYTLVPPDTANGKNTLEIVFNDFEQYSEQAGYTVQVRYQVALNSDAVVGSSANASSATLTYSSTPDYVYQSDNNTPTDGEPTATTAPDTVYVYTTAIDLNKVTAGGVSGEGAQFRLSGANLNNVAVRTYTFTPVESADASSDEGVTYYYKLTTGKYTTTAPTTDTLSTYENETKYTRSESVTTVSATEVTDKDGKKTMEVDFSVGADGYVFLEGLTEGTYTLEETVAPKNHDILNDPVIITIGWTAPGSDATQTCTWSFTEKNGKRDNGNVNLTSETTGRATLTVTDPLSPIIPSTGGIGTTIFYVAGAILVLSALVLLITKRRMR